MSKKEFIQALYKKRSTFNDPDQAEMMANLLDTVSSDIYSESQRFIFELIQNADDAALSESNEIHFDFHSNYLIVSHKGEPFDEADINAITNAGKGTKGSDATKTGYKGIGFKSVFGKSNKVTIFSDGYHFRFDRQFIRNSFIGVKMPWQIIPIWTEEINVVNEKKLIKGQFNVSTIIELNNANGLQEELDELLSNGKILLFLRRITKISISVNGNLDYSVEKKINKKEKYFDEVSLFKEDKEVSQWIVKTFDEIPIDDETKIALKQDEKTPDKLKEAEYTEISFAAKIENGKIKALKKEESLIFTYLPTKVIDFEFPFLVNGSFLTNASREGIHEDRIWNQWLFLLIGQKVFDWLDLLSTSNYKYQILHLLPNKFNSLQNDLKIAFDSAFEKYGKSKRFIPNKEFKLKKASEILIDETGLSGEDFISSNSLIEYINKLQDRNFSIDSFVNPKIELKHKLNSLGSFTFNLKNLEEFFTDDIFKSNHLPSQNIFLIKYFFNKANDTDSREWNEKLKSIPFIYAKGKKLKSPQNVCFPSISFETEFGDGVSVIHSEVYPKIEAEPRIRAWLENLGVKEPSDIAYIDNEIIGNIETCITDLNYKQITRYLLNQHKKGLLEEWHYRKLQDLKLFTTNKQYIPANQCYLSDIFEPSLKLEKINESGKYISEKYKEPGDLSSEWKTFFLKIGVSENISIQTISTSRNYCKSTGIEEQYFIEMGDKAAENHRYPHLVSSWNQIELEKIRYSEFTNDYKFSKEFWKAAFETIYPNNVKDYALMPWGYYGSYCRVENYFQWALINSSIFPTTEKVCSKASEVFINEKEIKELAGNYLPVFACETIPDDDWRRLIPFKEKLELEDYLTILTKVAKETEKDDELKNINKKRIGLIYNKLTSQIPNFSNNKKIQLSDWAKGNKLLCSSEKFENASELKWVKISGFTYSSDRLKLLFLPDNCDIDSENFEQLLSLFGVQIIDKFIPEIKNAEPNSSLIIQLHTILPYFVSIIEKRKYSGFSKEYERLTILIDKSNFFNATEIKLFFKYQTETIEGPFLNVFREGNKIYFKGRWTSPMTMFALIPELSDLLEVEGLNEELRLLLELDENEIKEWLSVQGINFIDIECSPEYKKSLAVVSKMTQEEPDDTKYLETDNSDEKSRISISQDAKDIIYAKLREMNFIVPEHLQIKYTIVKGIKNPKGESVTLVIKSGKRGKIYFNPSEWLELSKEDTQLFVVTSGNIVRNVTMNDLLRFNDDVFFMRFNTEAFVVKSNLKHFAKFFQYLKYTHFIFDTPESSTDYLEQFGLNKRNPSSGDLTADDIELLN